MKSSMDPPELLSESERFGLAVEPPAELSARIRAEVSKDLRPMRGLPVRARWGIAAVVVAITTAGVSVSFGDPGAATALGVSRGVVAAGGVGVVTLATYAGLARRGPLVSRRLRIILALAAPLAFVTLMLSGGVSGHDSGGAAHCLGMGAAFSALPLASFLVLWRKTDPFAPRVTGAMIGAWAGLCGAIGLSLACHAGGFEHALLGHGSAVLGGALVGAVVGRRVLAP